MRRLSRDEIGVLWLLAGVACLVFGFFGFAIVAPWTFHVMSVSEAALRCPGAIDMSWAAVHCSHGRPYEWELGLIRDHPVRYGVALVQTIVGLSAFFWCARKLKRYQ